MKKFLIALLSMSLVLAMMLSLTACMEKKSKKSQEEDEEESVSDTKKEEDEEETESDSKEESSGEGSFGGKDESADKEEAVRVDTIVGTWKALIPYADMVNLGGSVTDESLMAIYEDALAECFLTAVFEAKDDGTANFYYENVDQAGDNYLEAFEDYMRDGGIYTIYEAQGYSAEELDALAAESGMTIDSLIDMVVVNSEPAADSMEEMLEKAATSNTYTYADGEGTCGSYTITLEGATLKLESSAYTMYFIKQ